jgi:hypothetical protein
VHILLFSSSFTEHFRVSREIQTEETKYATHSIDFFYAIVFFLKQLYAIVINRFKLELWTNMIQFPSTNHCLVSRLAMASRPRKRGNKKKEQCGFAGNAWQPSRASIASSHSPAFEQKGHRFVSPPDSASPNHHPKTVYLARRVAPSTPFLTFALGKRDTLTPTLLSSLNEWKKRYSSYILGCGFPLPCWF